MIFCIVAIVFIIVKSLRENFKRKLKKKRAERFIALTA